MNDSWDDMRRAKEEQFFDQQNKEALARLKSRTGAGHRPSPITGKPMEQKTIMGVVVDYDSESGGVWLDRGELEQIVKASQGKGHEHSSTWFGSFFNSLYKK